MRLIKEKNNSAQQTPTLQFSHILAGIWDLLRWAPGSPTNITKGERVCCDPHLLCVRDREPSLGGRSHQQGKEEGPNSNFGRTPLPNLPVTDLDERQLHSSKVGRSPSRPEPLGVVVVGALRDSISAPRAAVAPNAPRHAGRLLLLGLPPPTPPRPAREEFHAWATAEEGLAGL